MKCGEGIDRAGGFAYQVSRATPPGLIQADASQGLGGILIEKIEGDFDNSAG